MQQFEGNLIEHLGRSLARMVEISTAYFHLKQSAYSSTTMFGMSLRPIIRNIHKTRSKWSMTAVIGEGCQELLSLGGTNSMVQGR